MGAGSSLHAVSRARLNTMPGTYFYTLVDEHDP